MALYTEIGFEYFESKLQNCYSQPAIAVLYDYLFERSLELEANPYLIDFDELKGDYYEHDSQKETLEDFMNDWYGEGHGKTWENLDELFDILEYDSVLIMTDTGFLIERN
jgi:hypothetical protein